MSVGVVTANELLRLARDRVGLFFVVVLPVVVIFMLGLTLFADADRFAVGVVDQDRTEASAALIEVIDATGVLEVRHRDEMRDVERDMHTGRLQAGVVIPAGYGAALVGDSDATQTGQPSSQVLLITEPAESTTNAIRSAVTGAVSEQGALVAAARFATDAVAGTTVDENLVRATELAETHPRPSPRMTEAGNGRGLETSGFDWAVPTQLTLFMFINALTAATAVVEARRLGVTRRMLGSPITAGSIVGGLAASRWVFAMVQGLLIVALGIGLGVAWGSPPGVVAILVLFAAVSAAAGLILGCVARTPEQAMAIGIPVGLGLAMLGGAMWPLEIVSDTMRTIGHLTPHAWAMDGWITLVYERGGVADLAVPLGVLAAYAAVLVGVAAVLLRRQLTG